MAHDAGHDDLAEQRFCRSLDLAQAGGDTQLSAHVYASLSHLSLHLDEPEAAISFARQGHRAVSETPLMPHLAARLLAMEARGFAAKNDSGACAKVLLRAEKVLEHSLTEEPSPWVSPFDAGSLASEAARCMQQLGQLDEAERQARRIIKLREGSHTRSRAFGQLLLVTVLLAKGNPDEACDLAREVLDATQALSSHRVTEQFQALRAMLEPYRTSATVAEFLPCLEEAVRQRLGLYGWMADGGNIP